MGGHEPINAVAGDHQWCITAFLATPTSLLIFEYGAEDSRGWIWVGSNGQFSVPAGATQEIIAAPLVLGANGTIDLRLTLDTLALTPGWTVGAQDSVRVKGTFSQWVELDLVDDGTHGDVTAADGVYTMVLSANVGPGTSLPHVGLLTAGVDAEFVFVVRGVEYKGTVLGWPGAVPLSDGVGAELMPPGGGWTPTPILRQSSTGNTLVRP